MNIAFARDQLQNTVSQFSQIRSSERFANLRSPREFLDPRRISRPANLSELQARIRHNLARYGSNYSAVFVLLALYALITNLTLVFVIVLAVGGMVGIGKLNGQNLSVGPVDLSTSQLYTGLLLVCVPLALFASPIGTIFWLLGANFVVIGTHAALLEPPVETAFEQVESTV